VIVQFLGKCFDRPAAGWMWWACAAAIVTLWPWLARRELWLLWLFPAAQLLVYLLIFQLTPHPLQWHLESAMPRLLFHVGPIAFLATTRLVLEAYQGIKLVPERDRGLIAIPPRPGGQT
jgi:hypothetical protein